MEIKIEKKNEGNSPAEILVTFDLKEQALNIEQKISSKELGERDLHFYQYNESTCIGWGSEIYTVQQAQDLIKKVKEIYVKRIEAAEQLKMFCIIEKF